MPNLCDQLPLSKALDMASFWQNKPEMANCNNRKKALENIISSSIFCKATHTKIKEASVLNSKNEFEKAYEIYKDILGENPNNTDALFGVGVILEKQKKFDLAIQFLSKAIESKPDIIEACLARGRIFRQQGMYENAILDFTDVVSRYPDNFKALIARGITFGQTRRFNSAINDFNMAIKINPNSAEAFYNLGVAHEKIHHFESAIDDYSIAVKLNPHDYKAYNNRGVARRETKCFEAALKDFEKSIKINPDFAEAYYNKSLTLLSFGMLKEGFQLYEYRWKTAHFQSQLRHFSRPLWLGNEDLTGKTILLHSEQGLGDSIQFCRYIKFFENVECRVLFEIEKPLMTIMGSLLPQENIFEKGSALPAFDFHCPLMSLPHAFGTTENSIPHKDPYLTPPQTRIKHWQNLLQKKTSPSIGLAWRGNPNHANDQRRSAKLNEIMGFLSEEYDWISLEKFPTKEELSLIRKTSHIRQFGAEIRDFSDTAALCSTLDAVISVDTSTAHLAASIGVQTHVLLRECADWRWLQNRPDTPWYETVTLHRKPAEASWGKLVEMVVANIFQKK